MSRKFLRFLPKVGNCKSSTSCRIETQCGPCAPKQYMDPQCKVALVTGGATGIGYAIADELLRHNLYKVVISGIDPCEGKAAAKRLNDQHGCGKACFLHMNTNCPKQFEDCFQEITVKYGGVDILVNNAGILQDSRWDLEIDTNMKAVIRGTLLAFRYMQQKKEKGGVVINNAALLAFDPFPYMPVYSATKAGVITATRCLGAKEHFDKTGVRVVAICPGFTETELLKNAGKHLLQNEWAKPAISAMGPYPVQKPGSCGRGVVYMVQYAPPGSIWAVEDAVLYKLNIPGPKTYSEKILQL